MSSIYKTFGFEGGKTGESTGCFLTVCSKEALGNRDYGSVTDYLPNAHRPWFSSRVTHTTLGPALTSHPLQRYGPSPKEPTSLIRTDLAARSQARVQALGRVPRLSEARQD